MVGLLAGWIVGSHEAMISWTDLMRLTVGMVRKGELWLSLLHPTYRIGKKRRDIHVHLLYFYVFIMSVE